jgi:hypothetical protein
LKLCKQIVLGSAVLAVLFSAGCKAAPAAQSSQSNTGQGQAGQAPGGMGTQGIVTQIDGSAITIAVMPAGLGQQAGDRGQPPTGSASPGATAPAAIGAPDTSSWQKTTYTIDGKTKIAQGQMPGSDTAQAQALTAADLKTGDNVSITVRAGQSGVADQVTVMPGGLGRQGRPQGTAPAATAKS